MTHKLAILAQTVLMQNIHIFSENPLRFKLPFFEHNDFVPNQHSQCVDIDFLLEQFALTLFKATTRTTKNTKMH